jgi:hypothetical protein
MPTIGAIDVPWGENDGCGYQTGNAAVRLALRVAKRERVNSAYS